MEYFVIDADPDSVGGRLYGRVVNLIKDKDDDNERMIEFVANLPNGHANIVLEILLQSQVVALEDGEPMCPKAQSCVRAAM